MLNSAIQALPVSKVKMLPVSLYNDVACGGVCKRIVDFGFQTKVKRRVQADNELIVYSQNKSCLSSMKTFYN